MTDELKTERIMTMMTPSEVKTLDDWAFANRIRSRGEAIRRLIEAGRKAAGPVPDTKPRGSGGAAPDEGAGGSRSGRSAKPTRSAAPNSLVSKEAQLRALRESRT